MNVEDLAKRIREQCIEAAIQAYEDAGIQGLCAEGRWEVAVSALRTVDLGPLLRELTESTGLSLRSNTDRCSSVPSIGLRINAG